MIDLAIVGGTVVTPEGPTDLDIGVTGGKIVLLAAPSCKPSIPCPPTPHPPPHNHSGDTAPEQAAHRPAESTTVS